MTSATPATPRMGARTGSLAALVRRRPLTAFLVLAFALGLPGLVYAAVAGVPTEPFLLLLVYVGLLGSSLVVTRVADGPGAVRRLLSRVLIWRFGVGRWMVVLFALPVLTVGLAAVSGTLSTPEGGWAAEVGWYLFNTLVFGALALNLWEETAWAGFAQSRLMARHGLLVASVVTGFFFALIHVPLYLADGTTATETVVALVLLFAAAPVYRYLYGLHMLDTRGSLLVVGLQHAAGNASVNLDSVDDGTYGWQVLVAVVLLTAMVAVGRRVRRPGSRPVGTDAEKAAATGWVTSTASARSASAAG